MPISIFLMSFKVRSWRYHFYFIFKKNTAFIRSVNLLALFRSKFFPPCYDCLFDLNINPSGKSKEELKRLYLITSIIYVNHSAIQQFASGVEMVSSYILKSKNYQNLKYMFESRPDENYDFDQVMTIFRYKQKDTLQQGSNDAANVHECITELELFLTKVGQKEIIIDNENVLSYTHLIQFCTGSDRIPTYGFEKKIDIEFVDVVLPRVSTCGLTLCLPKNANKIADSIVTAIKFGGGFGRI